MMSLRALNRQVEECRRRMDEQRAGTCHLLAQHKAEATRQVQKIPLPLAMGLAFAGGFVLQRFFDTPTPAFVWKTYLTWQAYS
mgnify:CR=1 FL=1